MIGDGNTRILSPEQHAHKRAESAALHTAEPEQAARVETRVIQHLQAAGWAWCPNDAGWVCTPPMGVK